MKLYHIFAITGILMILSPWFICIYQDWRDVKKIETIQWDITVGGNGTYTSKDGHYQLYVRHPYPSSIGDPGDEETILSGQLDLLKPNQPLK